MRRSEYKGVPQGVVDEGGFAERSRPVARFADGVFQQSGAHPRPATPAPSSASESARILVLEPVPVLRTIMTRALAARGYSVTTAATLADLQRLMPVFDPHLIIAELTLPDGSGEALCKRLKARVDKMRPLILISGVPEGELALRARNAGADRHHCKSRGLSELIELVDEITSEIVF